LRLADQLHADHQAAAGQRCADEADQIEGTRSARIALDQIERAQQCQQAERQVEVEDPVPTEVLGDQAADRWPENGRNQTGPGDDGDRIDEVAFAGVAQHHQTPDRHHHGPADALQDARGHKLPERVAQPAQGRGQGEDQDRAAKHSSWSIAISDPAADRNADRERDHIRADADRELFGQNAEAGGHMGQGRRDYRTVEIFHKKGRCDQEGQPTTCGI
jgi:hypothetical protein